MTDTNSKAQVTEEAIRKAGKVVIDHMADNGLTYEAVAQELTDCLMRIVDPDFIAALAAQEKPEPGVAVKAAKPFMYGIMEPDGTAYMDEVCVDLSADTLKEMIEEDEMTGYTVVPLYLHAAPSPDLPEGEAK